LWRTPIIGKRGIFPYQQFLVLEGVPCMVDRDDLQSHISHTYFSNYNLDYNHISILGADSNPKQAFEDTIADFENPIFIELEPLYDILVGVLP
jgi:hypothetical protein